MDKGPITATITDIQRFCLHDGPGVRTTFFFKGCPLNCLWCANPETREAAPELFFSKARCVGCGSCASACPKGLINVSQTAIIERDGCDKCFRCADVCPTTAISRKGREYSPDELVSIALGDKPFYDRSAGGVTASGGEPMLQSEAVAELFKRMKELGVNTALETAGCVPWSAFERVLPYCDFVYFDIKHADEEIHKRLTGVSARLIKENLRALAGKGVKVTVRAPMIPGLNADDEAVMALAELIKPLGFPVEPLPFHQLGQGKFEAIGRPYALKGKPALKPRDIERQAALLKEAGLEVII